MEEIFTKDEILKFNRKMLKFKAINEEDKKGYNKADLGACATYLYGLSEAQYADLTKRLVKYCRTQLEIDRDKMKATADHYNKFANSNDRSKGVSLNITDKGTLISFRYNDKFVKAMNSQPIRRYDKEHKNWLIPNDNAVDTLLALEKVGADVKNAIDYIKNKEMFEDGKKRVRL